MKTWTSDGLRKIATADELRSHVSTATLRNPVTIWIVRLGDDLYVRSYKGRGGPWFRAHLVCHEGQIQAGGVGKTSPSWWKATTTSTTRSTPRTAPSTAATEHATSTPWWALRREPRRSNWCRAQQAPNGAGLRLQSLAGDSVAPPRPKEVIDYCAGPEHQGGY